MKPALRDALRQIEEVQRSDVFLAIVPPQGSTSIFFTDPNSSPPPPVDLVVVKKDPTKNERDTTYDPANAMNDLFDLAQKGTEGPVRTFDMNSIGKFNNRETYKNFFALASLHAATISEVDVSNAFKTWKVSHLVDYYTMITAIFFWSPLTNVSFAFNAMNGGKLIHILGHLFQGPLINSVNLQDCGLGDLGAEALAQYLAPNVLLVYLNLCQNNIREEGVPHVLAILTGCVGLRILNLGGNNVFGKGGSRALSHAFLFLPNLVDLNLSGSFFLGSGLRRGARGARGARDDRQPIYNLCKGINAMARLQRLNVTDAALEINGILLLLEALIQAQCPLTEFSAGENISHGIVDPESELGQALLTFLQSDPIQGALCCFRFPDSRVDDAMSSQIFCALPGSTSHVDLSSNRVGVTGISALLGQHCSIPHTCRMNLQDNPIPQNFGQMLNEAFGDKLELDPIDDLPLPGEAIEFEESDEESVESEGTWNSQAKDDDDDDNENGDEQELVESIGHLQVGEGNQGGANDVTVVNDDVNVPAINAPINQRPRRNRRPVDRFVPRP